MVSVMPGQLPHIEVSSIYSSPSDPALYLLQTVQLVWAALGDFRVGMSRSLFS